MRPNALPALPALPFCSCATACGALAGPRFTLAQLSGRLCLPRSGPVDSSCRRPVRCPRWLDLGRERGGVQRRIVCGVQQVERRRSSTTMLLWWQHRLGTAPRSTRFACRPTSPCQWQSLSSAPTPPCWMGSCATGPLGSRMPALRLR
jgi:hypothetical protein